jgi:hypothetical protein
MQNFRARFSSPVYDPSEHRAIERTSRVVHILDEAMNSGRPVKTRQRLQWPAVAGDFTASYALNVVKADQCEEAVRVCGH